MSNAQFGSKSTPFRTEKIKQMSFTAGQEIQVGSMVKVMSRDMATSGVPMTLPTYAADTGHAYFGTFSKPYLANKATSSGTQNYFAFCLSSNNNASATDTTVTKFAGTAATAGPTYLRYVSWDASKSVIWSDVYGTDTILDKKDHILGLEGAWSWGEPYQIDKNHWLVCSQYGTSASAVDEMGLSHTYPAQVSLLNVNDEGTLITKACQDYTTGRTGATFTAFANTGKPFICPIKEKIGLVSSVQLPNAQKEVISADKGKFFLCKEYDFIMVYHAFTGSFDIQVRPFKVIIYDTKKYIPLQGKIEVNDGFEDTNDASCLTRLKEHLFSFGLEYVEGQGIYTKTETYKNIIHTVTVTVGYSEKYQLNYYYEIVHEFKVDEAATFITEEEIKYFNEFSRGADSIFFQSEEVQENGENTHFTYAQIEDMSLVSQSMAFTKEPLSLGTPAGAGAVPYPLYGHYCNFSDLESQQAMFLTVSPSDANEKYYFSHIKYDENEAVWTTSSTTLTPKMDSTIAKLDPGAASGSKDHGFLVSSQQLPLVIEYYNNYNIYNVIKSVDKQHCLAVFPYYYYDFQIDWKEAAISATIKSLIDKQNPAQLLTTKANLYMKNGASVVPTSTAITAAQMKYATEWDLATGNYPSSYCYKSSNAAAARVPFLFKMSDTGYLMSYLAPVFGYPGIPPAFASTPRGIVTKIIHYIDELPKLLSVSQYGLLMAGTAVTEPQAVGVPNAAQAKPYSFLTISKQGSKIQAHQTTHSTTSNSIFNGGVAETTEFLQEGVMDLWAYPVTSTKEYSIENAYQRPLFYGVAANAYGAFDEEYLKQLSEEGIELSSNGKIKLFTFYQE